MTPRIPFNRPRLPAHARRNVAKVLEAGTLASGGLFTRECEAWLRTRLGSNSAMLTTSCTTALELGALALGLGPGDEVIVPSFTFVSSANAFALRGATPVMVDIRADTQNIDPSRVADAISSRTRAVVPVHYAGVGCDMGAITGLAKQAGVAVFEDAAHALGATYENKALGSIGELGALSFHATKNVQSGEGGALLIQDAQLLSSAEIATEKGTDRREFRAGLADRYGWVSLGSSFQPAEVVAAVLAAALEETDEIIQDRSRSWKRYHDAFEILEGQGRIRRPVVPEACVHNAHIYYVLLESVDDRSACMQALRERGIEASAHYPPLHQTPGGRKYGAARGTLRNAERAGDCLLRLPLWYGMNNAVDEVIDAVLAFAVR